MNSKATVTAPRNYLFFAVEYNGERKVVLGHIHASVSDVFTLAFNGLEGGDVRACEMRDYGSARRYDAAAAMFPAQAPYVETFEEMSERVRARQSQNWFRK